MTDEDPPFIGNWEKKCILGTGSFGEVTLWKHKKNKQQIAIKKCKGFYKNIPKSDYEKLLSRWNQELKIMQNKECDYIVHAIDVAPENFIVLLNQTNLTGFPLLVMEYCEGGDLRKFLCKIENSNGLIESEIKNILKCLRNAIEHLHKNNLTHRDIKPENILIQHKNYSNFYKLADLGYAKEMEQTGGHSVVGTSEYIAPEVIGSTTYSKRVDYWSMGIIIFEIICGIRPFLPNSKMVERMVQLRKKTSKELAIRPTNIPSEYKKYEHIFDENQITDYFKKQIEEWLRLALEYNAKQRGSEFVKKISAPDEIQFQPEPPEYRLTFYTKLDEILNTKILTIFCLSNYKFLSYSVNKLNNLNELLMAIENDTQIPVNEIYIILPMEQRKINKIDQNTKPSDFYLENQYDSPMIYVTRYKQVLERKSTDPYISDFILDIINNTDNQLELTTLKEFARHVLFLYRNEQKHYVELVKGLKTYAINLNDLIVKLNSMVFQVNNKTMIACANIRMHLYTISYSKQKLEENNMLEFSQHIMNEWDQYVDKLEDDYKLQEINARNQKSYESVLRRSKEVIDSKLLEIQDFYNVKQLEEIYNNLRKLRDIRDITEINKTKNIFEEYCHNCIKKRKELLKSRELEHIQKEIIGIHTEFVTIFDIVNKLNVRLDKYEHTIQKEIFKHQDQICEIFQNFTKQKIEHELSNIHNINGIIDEQINPKMINNNSVEQSSNHILNNGEQSQSSITMKSMNLSIFGNIDDTKDIISENTDNLKILLSLSNEDSISDLSSTKFNN